MLYGGEFGDQELISISLASSVEKYLLQPPRLARKNLLPRLPLPAPELPDSHDILGPKVAVQMRTPICPVYLVPFDAGRVKVGEAQLEDVEGGAVFEEEIGCDGYLLGGLGC